MTEWVMMGWTTIDREGTGLCGMTNIHLAEWTMELSESDFIQLRIFES